MLSIDLGGPGAALPGQTFSFPITLTNRGSFPAFDVILTQRLPLEGMFVAGPGSLDGNTLTVAAGELGPGESTVLNIQWQSPNADATLLSEARADASNAAPVTDDATVQVSIVTTVDEAAIVSAGTGLRNRDSGTITIAGIPDDGRVTRAVLVWALLYGGTNPPSNEITLDGQRVSADLEATISGTLCWGDQGTIGYAADVTSIVQGNGDFVITDAINGVIRPDANPLGEVPYTDGASLFVFYGAPGISSSVASDFTYTAVPGGEIIRELDGFESNGGSAMLHMAGPDGQSNVRGADVLVVGSGATEFETSWNGDAPQSGPSFSIGNLWDSDIYDVSSVLPAGQASVTVGMRSSEDCYGLSGVALQVD